MPGLTNTRQFRTVPATVIDAKLRAEGTLRQIFPELATMDSPLTRLLQVVRAADISEVIRKISDKGVKTIDKLLERTVSGSRDEFGLDDDELRTMMSALVLLWWQAYKEKLRADSLKETRNVAACHSCSGWGREVILKINGRQIKLANVIAEYGTGAMFDLTGKPDVEVLRIACSCELGKELHKLKVPIQ